MDKFTTRELTIEILEDIPAHKVSRVRINGKETVMEYYQIQFLRGYAKETKSNCYCDKDNGRFLCEYCKGGRD